MPKRKRSKRSHRKHINSKLMEILKFFVKLNILAIPLFIIITTNYQSAFLMDITTGTSFFAIKSTMEANIEDNIITIPIDNGVWGARISWDSTGWKSMLALFALIFATDFSLRKKALGLILIPIVYAINIVRIWFMFFAVKIYGVEIFDLIHTVIWSWGLIITILILWVLWMKYFPNNPKSLKFIPNI